VIIGIARSSGIVGIPAWVDYLLPRTAQIADPESEMQRGSQFSSVWDLCYPSKSRSNHHEEG
jgi:hypothetical protein